MHWIRSFLILLGRFFLSLVFLASGMNKIFHWDDQEAFLFRILSEWQSYTSSSLVLQDFFSMAIPFTPVFLIVAVSLEFVGALLILTGIYEKLGAFFLLAFLGVTTFFVHQFWFVDGLERELQLGHFLKNLAIMGGLIVVMIQGAKTERVGPSRKF